MKAILLAILVGVVVLPSVGARGQEVQDDDLTPRGFFIRSRSKTAGTSGRAGGGQKPAKPAATPAVAAAPPAATPEAASPASTLEPAVEPAGVIALGYSVFRESPSGAPVRVDPASAFRVGDRLRLQLEPNVDGYLYVFATESGANPTMLYPDARLAGGANDVAAHGLVEIPSRHDPQHKWFKIAGPAAVERIYIVVSRERLPGVPTGDELVRYCAAYKGDCPWKPNEAVWARIVTLAGAPVEVSAIADAGRNQTQAEEEVLARKIVLSPDDAEPTVVATGKGPGGVLVSTVDIKHE